MPADEPDSLRWTDGTDDVVLLALMDEFFFLFLEVSVFSLIDNPPSRTCRV